MLSPFRGGMGLCGQELSDLLDPEIPEALRLEFDRDFTSSTYC
jgi:hypothetical protein